MTPPLSKPRSQPLWDTYSRAIRSMSRDLQTLSVTFRPMMSKENNLGQTSRELGASASRIETTLEGFPDLIATVADAATQVSGVVVSLEALRADIAPSAGTFELVDRHLSDAADFARSGWAQTAVSYMGFVVAALFFLMGTFMVVVVVGFRRGFHCCAPVARG